MIVVWLYQCTLDLVERSYVTFYGLLAKFINYHQCDGHSFGQREGATTILSNGNTCSKTRAGLISCPLPCTRRRP